MGNIYIEGNVGAGKSTLLKFIEQEFNLKTWREPHELWQNVDGHNLLELFFLEQARWAFTFQSYITTTQVQQIEEAKKYKQKVKFFERSIYAGRYCFAANAYDMKLLNSAEWAVYQNMWNFQTKHVSLPVGFIYLRIPAETCLHRIKKRGRFEERPISLSYLLELEKKHDDWLLRKQIVPKPIADIPVLVLDDIGDIMQNSLMRQNYKQKITLFMQQFLDKV